MVALGVVGILVSLTLPVFTSVRERAKELKSLANMRTHTQVLATYTGEFRDVFPYMTDPEADLSVIRGGGQTVWVGFFELTSFWYLGLTDRYYGGVQNDFTLFTYPDYHRGHLYQYSSTLFSRPEYWVPGRRRVGAVEQLRAVKSADVRFPSAKVAFTEFRDRDDANYLPLGASGRIFEGEGFGFGFLDGSARRPPTASLTLPYPTGDGGGPHSNYGTIGIVGVHTINGVLGRDVE